MTLSRSPRGTWNRRPPNRSEAWSDGFSKARYDFYLPKNLYGTPTMHVYADRLCCSSSVVKKTLVHVEGRHYRIVIKVSRSVRYDVRSVSLSYYVR